MHGRLKVKTPAEQQEAKRLEREKKISKYKEGMKQLLTLRGNDDAESMTAIMKLTGLLLTANSDLYTLWNYRKEVFKKMEERNDEEEIQSLYSTELDFIDATLVHNPKSYCLWEHRVFCMRRMPDPDWSTELKLTSKFLEYDERNFHCWDYRRFVVAASPKSATPKDELDFTFDKISNNFSNYSSWHYRSKLLPLVHPDDDCLHGIQETALLAEFSHTMNAVFTDPNDQSAWFYHRWLLGRKDRPFEVDLISVSRPVNHDCGQRDGRGVLVFSKAVKVGESVEVKVRIDGVLVPSSSLRFSTPSDADHSPIWVCHLPASLIRGANRDGGGDESADGGGDGCGGKLHHEISFETEFVASSQGAQSSLTLPPDLLGVTYRRYQETLRGETTLFRHEMSAAQNVILTSEMESCQQLLELEPGNKWTLLTLIHIMRALEPLGHQDSILSNLEELISVDPLRRGFYCDFRSKYLMENEVDKLAVREDIFQTLENLSAQPVDLSSRGLTSIHYAVYLTGSTKVDLSKNEIRHLESLAQFQNVRNINVAHNQISSCKGLEFLPMLNCIDLSWNRLSSLECLTPLRSCEDLQTVKLAGNPIVKSDAEGLVAWFKLNLPHVSYLLD